MNKDTGVRGEKPDFFQWQYIAKVIPGSTVNNEILGYQYKAEEELANLLKPMRAVILKKG